MGTLKPSIISFHLSRPCLAPVSPLSCSLSCPLSCSLSRPLSRSLSCPLSCSLSRPLSRSLSHRCQVVGTLKPSIICLAPVSLPVSPLSRSLSRSLSHPLSRSLSRPLSRSLSRPLSRSLSRPLSCSLSRPLSRSLSRPYLGFSVPTKMLQCKVPTTMRGMG